MKGGLVGTLDMDTGEVVGTYPLSDGEMIENGSATDEAGGVILQAIAIMEFRDGR